MKTEEKQAQTQVEEIKIKQTKGSEKHPSEQYYSIKTPFGIFNVKASLLPAIPKIGDQFNVRYTETKYVYEGKDVVSKWVVSVIGPETSNTAQTANTSTPVASTKAGVVHPSTAQWVDPVIELKKDVYAMFMVGVKCLINQEDILFPEYLTRVEIAKQMIAEKNGVKK